MSCPHWPLVTIASLAAAVMVIPPPGRAAEPPISPLPTAVTPETTVRFVGLTGGQRDRLTRWAEAEAASNPGRFAELMDGIRVKYDERIRKYDPGAADTGLLPSQASRELGERLGKQVQANQQKAFQEMLEPYRMRTVQVLAARHEQVRRDPEGFIHACENLHLMEHREELLDIAKLGMASRFAKAGKWLKNLKPNWPETLVVIIPELYNFGKDLFEQRLADQERRNQELRDDLLLNQLNYVRQTVTHDGKKTRDAISAVENNLNELRSQEKEVYKNTIGILNAQRELLVRQTELGKAVADVKRTQDFTLRRVEAVHQQEKINTALLLQNQSALLRNAESLDYMKRAMYSKLSPDEQLVWLEQNVIHLPPEKRSNELRRVRSEMVRDDRLAVAGKIDSYLTAGDAVMRGLEKLGVDPSTVRKGREVLAKGTSVNSVFKAVVKCDWFAAIGGVLGLFDSGPDPADVRHQELLQEFAQVHQSLQEIKTHLKQIEGKIDELKQLTQKQHMEVLQRFDWLTEEALTNRQLLAWLADVLKKLRQSNNRAKVAFPNNRLKTWEDPADAFILTEGIGLARTVVPRPGIDVRPGVDTGLVSPALLLLATNREDNEKAKQYRERDVKPAYLAFETLFPTEEQKQHFSDLARRANPQVKLRFPTDQTRPDAYSLLGRFDVAGKDSLGVHLKSDQFLSPVAVLEFASLILDVAGDLQLLKPDGLQYIPISGEHLSKAPDGGLKLLQEGRDRARDLLLRADYLVNLAVAQQSIMAGDNTVAHVYDNLWVAPIAGVYGAELHAGDPLTRAAPLPAIRDVLSTNLLHRQNLALYIILRSGVTPFAYERYYTSADPWYLEEAIQVDGRRFQLRKRGLVKETDDPGVWHITVAPGLELPLPTPDRIVTKRYYTTPLGAQLIECRRKIAHALAATEMAENLTAEEGLLLWYLEAAGRN